MGFKVIKDEVITPITINDLNPTMIFELINCYALDYSAEDVECRVPAHDGVVPMDYPIINKDVVQQFFDQLDIFRDTVKDIIIGNYHTGLYEDNRDGLWIWGHTPTSSIELLQWVKFVIYRDFAQEGTWMYTLTEGNMSALDSFVESATNLFIQANDHGSYADVVIKVKHDYPFIQY